MINDEMIDEDPVKHAHEHAKKTSGGHDQEDLSLVEIIAVVWRYKIMILIITIIAAVSITVYHLIAIKMPPEESYLPNSYTSEALILVDNSAKGRAGIQSSMQAEGAGLGISNVIAHSEYSDLAVFLIKTNAFLDSIISKFNITERYNLYGMSKESQRDILKKNVKVRFDPLSGVLSIGFTNAEPAFTRDVANYIANHLIQRLNELIFDKDIADKNHLDDNLRRTQLEIRELENETQKLERSVVTATSSGRYNAVMTEIDRVNMELSAKRLMFTHLKVQQELANVKLGERPVFQLLELAEAPERRSGPNRSRSCIIVTLAAFAASILLAFVFEFFVNIIKNPKARTLFSGKKERYA